jgi:hypothetical protein
MVKNKKKWKNGFIKKHVELLNLVPKEVVTTLTLDLQPKQNLGKV